MQAPQFETLLLCVTIFTVLLQIYVLFLIQKKTAQTMTEYKFFLNMLTIWDMAFSALLGIFLQPDPLMESPSAVIKGLSTYFGKTGHLWAAAAVLFAGVCVVVSQNHCLLYRYFVLHNNRSIYGVFMSKTCKIIYVLQGLIFGMIAAVMFYKTFVFPDNVFQLFLTQWPNVFDKLKGDEKVLYIDVYGFWPRVFFATLLSLFMMSEIACFSLIYLILSKLKRKASGFSKLTYRLHFQFTILLMMELMTPLIFIFGPVAAFILAGLFGKVQTEFPLQIGLMLLALYGTTNATLTICFVGPYRIHAFNTFIRPWLRPIFKALNIESKLVNESQTYSMHASFVGNTHYQLSNNDRIRRGSVFVLPYKRDNNF